MQKMKSYLFYLQKGFSWSIPFILFILYRIIKTSFETIGWYLIAAVIFIYPGPLWSYAVLTK